MTDLTAKINGCFSMAWTDLPYLPGYVINQQPAMWQLSFVDPGDSLYGADDVATGYCEAVHKLNKQLPPEEQITGPNETRLILCHDEATAAHEPAVYKIFSQGGGFGTELRQTVTGLKPGSEATVIAHIWCDVPDSGDPYAAEFYMETAGQGKWWQYITKMPPRTYVPRQQARIVPENGELEIIFRFKAKYQISSNFFIDLIQLEAELADSEPPVDPPPDPPPTDHDHPDIDEQLDSLQAQYDALAMFAASLDERLTAVENGQTQPPPSSGLYRYPLGVDVSYAQAYDTNWPELAANGVVFASIRCGSGKTPKDANFDWNWQQAGQAGILRMTMWFLYHGGIKSPEQQAQEYAALVPGACELWPRYNLEKDENGIFVPESEVICFLDEFGKIKGYRPRIYTAGWVINGRYSKALDDGDGWFAWYGDNASIPGGQPTIPNGWQQPWRFWQWTSKGGDYVGHVKPNLDLDWFNGTYAQLAAYSKEFLDFSPTTPPTGETIDMLPYLRGPDKIQYDTDAKLFTQTYQYRHDGNLWRLVKGGNGQYECLYYDANYVYRREDISQDDDKFYVHLTNGVPGAPWIKRHMKVGETAVFTKQVQHYWNDCTERLPLATVADSIKLVARHNSYTFPTTGKTLRDVIELHWLEGDERYWFAKGWGLVGFTDKGIVAEFMNGPLLGRADLPIKPPGCIDLNPRYFG